jgi:hypothetical protein
MDFLPFCLNNSVLKKAATSASPPLPSLNVSPNTLPKLLVNQPSRAVPPSAMSERPCLFCQMLMVTVSLLVPLMLDFYFIVRYRSG